MSNSNQQQTLQEQQITSECKHETHENTEKTAIWRLGSAPTRQRCSESQEK